MPERTSEFKQAGKRALLASIVVICSLGACFDARAQTLAANLGSRAGLDLGGKWEYIVDPYETGFYDYRYHERRAEDPEAYWNTGIARNKTDRLEFGYSDRYTLHVPGDWNSQADKFLYYEGSVWYSKTFNYKTPDPSKRFVLWFGAVNYRADVYLNGHKLGMHEGGFTPFCFEIPLFLLKESQNHLVVRVNNNRHKEDVPTLNTDWWNYGGITRDVKLLELAHDYISDYTVTLIKSPDSTNPRPYSAIVALKMSDSMSSGSVLIEVPELKIKKAFPFAHGSCNAEFALNKDLRLWSPEQPKLYQLVLNAGTDRTEDKIGFRTIEVKNEQILLNGKPLFLKGICIHGENPAEGRRAFGPKDARQLLGWAKELNCNMVRLAHYPHDEAMTRAADSMGLLVWSEIPVYWTIDFSSPAVFEKANTQLSEMIARDKNRASVIIWSVGNETPPGAQRTEFMHGLIKSAKAQDPSRLVTAALAIGGKGGANVIDDPLGEFTDIISINEYLGWYNGRPDQCRDVSWESKYKKPMFFSETGAEALGGYHADSLTRWSEEYQAWYYREQIAMFKKLGPGFAGLSPWILADFRSPRRNNPTYQEGWNNKGLIDRKGKKKLAFEVLKAYYSISK